jgi:hypothetical protein
MPRHKTRKWGGHQRKKLEARVGSPSSPELRSYRLTRTPGISQPQQPPFS